MTSLKEIGKLYRNILDPSYSLVIPAAVERVGATREQYEYAKRNQSRGLRPEPWGYTIEHNHPLLFKSSNILKGIDLQVDVCCDIGWEDDDVPVKQSITVRIWSQHAGTVFNEQRDSQKIAEELTDPARLHLGRVVSRFHLDRVSPRQAQGARFHPEYHLQFGGVPEDYELCWHPKAIDVPRLEYHPMELFLVCQMIAANFFWEEYLEIREKIEWRQEVILYQDLLLLNHFRKCVEAIENKKSLLDAIGVG